MAIVISGVNNNDKITASDGTIDLLSGVNYTGIITAPSITASNNITSSNNITAGNLNIGSNIQLGNAGVATATTFVGNLTGNVNATSNLLLQIGGSEKFRVASSGQLGIGGANYGTSGQVLTSGGSGSAATWSTITGTTINNNADNRIITGSGTANTLEGEANLTFNGGATGDAQLTVHAAEANANSDSELILETSNDFATSVVMFKDSTAEAGSIAYNHGDNYIKLSTNGINGGIERVRIDAGGNMNVTGIVTATSFVPTSQGAFSHRNLIINGAMTVAQRRPASAGAHQGEGYRTVDRFRYNVDPNPNELPNQEQHILNSGDTGPYEEGFRFSYLIENGNQGTQPSNGNIEIFHRIEAQDIHSSGWNYLSTSSFVTLSFWAKSSVTQTFYGRLMTETGPASRNFPFEVDLVGGTWKKFIIKIPGASNLAFTNTHQSGLRIEWVQAAGTDQSGSAPLNQWSTYSSTDRYPAVASTWYDTDNATFELTGVQLEVGPVATPFEHRTYADDLRRCQRYFQLVEFASAMGRTSTNTGGVWARFTTEMRTSPVINTMNVSNFATDVGLNLQGDNATNTTQSSYNMGSQYTTQRGMYLYDLGNFSGLNVGRTYVIGVPGNNSVVFTATAEL